MMRIEYDLKGGFRRSMDEICHIRLKRRQQNAHGCDHVGLKIASIQLRRDVKDSVGVLQYRSNRIGIMDAAWHPFDRIAPVIGFRRRVTETTNVMSGVDKTRGGITT